MEYEFRLLAENSNGRTYSDWITSTTKQDSMFISLTSRNMFFLYRTAALKISDGLV